LASCLFYALLQQPFYSLWHHSLLPPYIFLVIEKVKEQARKRKDEDGNNAIVQHESTASGALFCHVEPLGIDFLVQWILAPAPLFSGSMVEYQVWT
jgi:hypothetical protein